MDKEIVTSGKNIFYRVIGRGKPIMLVHGFGETGNVWNEQTGFLESKFQLIIPDLPGSGRSEMIDDMSIEGMAEVLKAIFEKELRQASDSSQIPPSGGGGAMIGHSMGGYVTLAFADKYPGYLSAFGLFHSTAFTDSEEKKANRRKGIEFIKDHGALEFIKTTTPNLFSPETKGKRPELVDGFIQSLPAFSPEALVGYYQAMMNRPNRVAVLKNFKKPILFVMGKFDIAAPLEDVLKQCHVPEKAYVHILQRSGHQGMIEEPQKSNQLLAEFLTNT
jgi:pimeloyl-ACP methyl ester carboxylesterase